MPTIVRVMLLGLLLIAHGGCATLGAGDPDEVRDGSEFLEGLKALKGTGRTTGVSREAREIESHLGGF